MIAVLDKQRPDMSTLLLSASIHNRHPYGLIQGAVRLSLSATQKPGVLSYPPAVSRAIRARKRKSKPTLCM